MDICCNWGVAWLCLSWVNSSASLEYFTQFSTADASGIIQWEHCRIWLLQRFASSPDNQGPSPGGSKITLDAPKKPYLPWKVESRLTAWGFEDHTLMSPLALLKEPMNPPDRATELLPTRITRRYRPKFLRKVRVSSCRQRPKQKRLTMTRNLSAKPSRCSQAPWKKPCSVLYHHLTPALNHSPPPRCPVEAA